MLLLSNWGDLTESLHNIDNDALIAESRGHVDATASEGNTSFVGQAQRLPVFWLWEPERLPYN